MPLFFRLDLQNSHDKFDFKKAEFLKFTFMNNNKSPFKYRKYTSLNHKTFRLDLAHTLTDLNVIFLVFKNSNSPKKKI